jgi:hypothetical protein
MMHWWVLVHSGPMYCFEAPLKIGQVSSFVTNVFDTHFFVIDQSRLAFHFLKRHPHYFFYFYFFIFSHDF